VPTASAVTDMTVSGSANVQIKTRNRFLLVHEN